MEDVALPNWATRGDARLWRPRLKRLSNQPGKDRRDRGRESLPIRAAGDRVMDAINRQPRLLVKTRAVPAQVSLSFRNKTRGVRFAPLFTSIRPAARPGLAAAGTWHVMTTDAPGDEVNAWDLCHHLLREGFGVAGAATPEFAEPDLEQRWTFGSPAEHTLALTRSCDGPEPPDDRLPSGGSGPYWFRDSDHSQLEKARDVIGDPTTPHR